ncbi:MAG: hypothetical protein QNJ44_04745 [Rhodobacter sp.]|nr:hypothetical protein [Rhodobacter sp.]
MKFRNKIKRFSDDSFGGLSVEAVMIIPLLLWAFLGLFVLFDSFHAKATNVKASAMIGDLLSRETNEINAAYMDGLNDVLDFLTHSPHDTIMRVSVVRYDGAEDEHILVWSHATAGKEMITEGTLSTIVPHIPVVQDAGSVIVVETWMAYVPFLNIAIEPLWFQNTVVTSPRFAPQLKWESA